MSVQNKHVHKTEQNDSEVSREPFCLKPSLSPPRPTPRITWTKDGEDLQLQPPARAKNFNKLIQIPRASFDDSGEYVCTASNKKGYIQHTITVSVKGESPFTEVAFPSSYLRGETLKRLLCSQLTAAPFWLEKPVDLVLAPEESGRLVCRADGAPRPTVNWFINGEPIEGKLSATGQTVSMQSQVQ